MVIYEKNVQPRNEIEMQAFIGILILLGANSDSKLDIHDHWSNKFDRYLYIVGMSYCRFNCLQSIIQFGDKQDETD